jgi:hypothetical protein
MVPYPDAVLSQRAVASPLVGKGLLLALLLLIAVDS